MTLKDVRIIHKKTEGLADFESLISIDCRPGVLCYSLNEQKLTQTRISCAQQTPCDEAMELLNFEMY